MDQMIPLDRKVTAQALRALADAIDQGGNIIPVQLVLDPSQVQADLMHVYCRLIVLSKDALRLVMETFK